MQRMVWVLFCFGGRREEDIKQKGKDKQLLKGQEWLDKMANKTGNVCHYFMQRLNKGP